MKTKYLFCKCLDVITRDTLFVDVYVGRSKQDLRDSEYLTELACSPDYFYAKYDDVVSDFVYNLRCSFDCVPGSFQFPVICSMTVKELRRLLRAGDYERYSATFIHVVTSLSTRFCINDAFRLAHERAAQVRLHAAHVVNLKLTKKTV